MRQIPTTAASPTVATSRGEGRSLWTTLGSAWKFKRTLRRITPFSTGIDMSPSIACRRIRRVPIGRSAGGGRKAYFSDRRRPALAADCPGRDQTLGNNPLDASIGLVQHHRLDHSGGKING